MPEGFYKVILGVFILLNIIWLSIFLFNRIKRTESFVDFVYNNFLIFMINGLMLIIWGVLILLFGGYLISLLF